MSTQQIDPKSWLDGVDAQWNTSNLDGAMAYFAEDAVASLQPPPPGATGAYHGKAEIRNWVQSLLAENFRVVSTNHRQNGDTITWRAAASYDTLRALGVDTIEADGAAVLDNGTIKSFTLTFTPATIAHLRAAITPHH